MPKHNAHPLAALSGNHVFSAEGIAPLVYGITGAFTRQEFDVGSYQANADCSGGQLIFNLSSHPVQFDFWWAEGFQRLAFISTSAGVPVIGSASR